jgi:hypothetical protein
MQLPKTGVAALFDKDKTAEKKRRTRGLGNWTKIPRIGSATVSALMDGRARALKMKAMPKWRARFRNDSRARLILASRKGRCALWR